MTREESIDIIRKNIPHFGIGATEMTDALKELIPELREGEDERIRKAIVKIVEQTELIDWNYNKKQMLAWLEKQKEQMMKEAVEGEVCGRVYDHINVRFADGVCKFLEPKNISHIPADVSKYKVGDKVRIIIVKEN